MMSCKQAAELVSLEQDRQLTFFERINLRIHVLICDACSNYRQQIHVLRDACKRFGSGGTP